MSGSDKSRVTVVGIGASAGGIKALQTLLAALPPKPGAAFVVILHLDPTFPSELPSILGAHTAMPVTAVAGKLRLEENHVYVIAPNSQLEISDSEIAAIPFRQARGQRAPIDSFFRSLAAKHGDGFAVILTGAGSDGAVGVKSVKETGGIILVQDPDEAEYASMPHAAIATEAADFVLPVKQLGERLAELIRAKGRVAVVQRAVEEDNLRLTLAHLRARTGHDFSHYKRSTVVRRLLRRMQITRKDAFEDYFSYLREHAEEAQALLADLLISVTTFFRDPKVFEALAANVIPHFFGDGEPNPVRVWVAGCASGEEAYSIAMLLMEEASKHEFRPEIQVFASDMDVRALAIAREGRYPAAIEADVNEDRLRRFFIRDGEYYRVKRELRDIVLFAGHSLLKDPPFSRLNLVSCRNLLIYLDRDLQQMVLATLHYALLPNGYLLLGSSESGEHPAGLFRAVDRDARIYQSANAAAERVPLLPRILGIPPEQQDTAARAPVNVRSTQAAHRQALEQSAPPSALVDQGNRVLHLSENAGRYMQPSAGPITSDITELVRQELRADLRSALHRAFEKSENSLSGPIPVRFNGSAHPVHLQVRAQESDSPNKVIKQALVFFIEGEADMLARHTEGVADQSDGAVRQLRRELELTQVRLRTMREESESANEELRAANEELQSINEEYRSTAEELETSKEELQSINEELQTVNTELKLKLETVSRANSDLQNLMAATDFGILFLDTGLRIKRFTPRLADLFNITGADIGRPVTDFTHQLDYDHLAADARQVLDDLAPVEREIRARNGTWYMARFRPYRTVDDRIDGIVAIFVDISERRQLHSEREQMKDEREQMKGEREQMKGEREQMKDERQQMRDERQRRDRPPQEGPDDRKGAPGSNGRGKRDD